MTAPTAKDPLATPGTPHPPEPAGVDRPGGAGPELRTVLEAILLVVDEPASLATLAQIAERPTAEVTATVEALATEYAEQGRGFRLREVSGGWRLFTAAECSTYVERYVLDGQTARLSQAALETLAVVAYQQPVSRSRIAAIRGVSVDGVIRTLVGRGLVAETGTDPTSGALLYSTTQLFLEKMGLRDLTELPDLAPLLPDLTTFMTESYSIST